MVEMGVSPSLGRPMPRLDPTLDLVFRLLLTRQTALLKDMLEGILARSIAALELRPSDVPGRRPDDKRIILDVHVECDDGSRTDVEMQTQTPANLASRLTYYATRTHADQLNRGDEYHLLAPTTVVAWLKQPLFDHLHAFHNVFRLREDESNILLTDHLSVHVLQLSRFGPFASMSRNATVNRWARFFLARTDAEFDRLALEGPIMRLATDTLDQLSKDPDTLRLIRAREDEIKLYRMELHQVRVESEAKGEAKGKARVLLELLERRFGPLSASVRARIEAAAPPQLDRWIGRILSAQTIEGVLEA